MTKHKRGLKPRWNWKQISRWVIWALFVIAALLFGALIYVRAYEENERQEVQDFLLNENERFHVWEEPAVLSCSMVGEGKFAFANGLVDIEVSSSVGMSTQVHELVLQPGNYRAKIRQAVAEADQLKIYCKVDRGTVGTEFYSVEGRIFTAAVLTILASIMAGTVSWVLLVALFDPYR